MSETVAAKCLSCGLMNFSGEAACKRCGADLAAPARAVAEVNSPCPLCGGPFALVTIRPDDGLGWLTTLVGFGLLFSFFYIPIVALTAGPATILVGFYLAAKKRSTLHCRSCGTMFPVVP